MTKIIFITLFFFATTNFAEKPPLTFGKIDSEQLEMEIYDAEPEAPAVILADYGEAGWNQYGKLELERHVRIKILKPGGIQYASVTLPFRWYQATKDKVSYIKAASYHLENGKVITTKLQSKEVRDEGGSLEYRKMSFTIPGARVGSVIEYRYQHTTQPLWFPRWNFQNALPTLLSEFNATIPELYEYLDVAQGGSNFDEHTVKNVVIPLTIDQAIDLKSRDYIAVHVTTRMANYQIRGKEHHWVIRNLPSLQEEPFSAPLENYRRKLAFQLKAVRLPDNPPVNILGSWKDLREKLTNAGHLGAQLKKEKRLIRQKSKEWLGSSQDPKDKIVALYNELTKRVSWDGEMGIRADRGMRKVLEGGEGNAAEIALFLIALIRSAGIDAYPVLLSTREHGTAQSLYPVKEQFNYIVANAQIEGHGYLLDPTDPLRPAGMLSQSALNGDGWMIGHKKDGWVDMPEHRETARVTLTGELDEKGKLEAKITLRDYGYQAIECRRKIQAGALDGREWLELETTATISDQMLEGVNEIDQELVRKLGFSTQLPESGDSYKFKPVVVPAFLHHPFPAETRSLPIDFIYPRDWSYTLSVVLPDSFTVDQVPQPVAISAPESSLVFRQSTSVTGNMLTMRASVKINRPRFEKESYQGLRQFFGLVVKTLNKEIKLAKKAS